MTTIAQQLQELRTLSPAELARQYEDLFGKPPRVRNKAWLFRQCAFRLQEQAYGSLSERAKTRLTELMALVDLPLCAPTPTPRAHTTTRTATKGPMVGTTLLREWRGQQIRVEVREDGFEWNGVMFKSLSAVAKAITGATWNGNLFFNLKSRKAGA